MLSRSKLVTVLVALMAAVPLQAGAASWTICNKAPENLLVAIAYLDKQNRWVSEGWWNLQRCGGCARVMDLSQTDAADQFYRAISSSGLERVSGGDRFCVSPQRFTVPNRGQCPAGFSAAGFRRVKVEYSDRNHTSNINPAPGGPVCMD